MVLQHGDIYCTWTEVQTLIVYWEQPGHVCRVSWMYKSQFPQKSCRHFAHLSLALIMHHLDECKWMTHRYRPVGLTPSGTGCLASGTISISHPKHSGTASGASLRSSSVTTPNLATGNSNQKLRYQLLFQREVAASLPPCQMRTTDNHEITNLTICWYITQFTSTPRT